MLLTLWLAAVSSVPTASVPLRPMNRALPVSTRNCPNAYAYQADNGPNQVRARRLDELPPGRLELTVLRSFDGCPIPAVLREGIGGGPRNEDEGRPARR